jgi:hypothetical protein
LSDSAPQKHPTVFQRLAPVENAHAIKFWFTLTTLLILAAWIIANTLTENQQAFRAISICMALGLTTVPLGSDIGYAIVLNWTRKVDNFAENEVEEVSTWFRAELKVISGNQIMIICGITLGLLSLLAFYSGGYFNGYSRIAATFLALVMFASASFAGMGLYVVFWISRTFWQMGKLEKLSLKIQDHRFGILSIGTVLFKCWMIIGAIWCIYSATAFVGYTGEHPENISRLPPMWLLAYPTLPFILGSFIVCQIPLHNKMVAFKQAEILRLDQMLDEIQPTSVEQITGDRMGQIGFLEKQKEQARALPDWPFNKISLLGTGASSFTALLPMLSNEQFPGWFNTIIDAINK